MSDEYLRATPVHGIGMRPDPEFTIDPAELAEWTAKNKAAARAYRERPNAVTAKIYKASA